jgi:hypothetical protein
MIFLSSFIFLHHCFHNRKFSFGYLLLLYLIPIICRPAYASVDWNYISSIYAIKQELMQPKFAEICFNRTVLIDNLSQNSLQYLRYFSLLFSLIFLHIDGFICL